MKDDVLRIGQLTFTSRLFVGTGKYKDLAETESALAASGAEVVTVAVRRVNLQERGEGSMMGLLRSGKYTILPNTAGCYTAEEALRTARLARELLRDGPREAGGHRRSSARSSPTTRRRWRPRRSS
jgi:thiazole synthase